MPTKSGYNVRVQNGQVTDCWDTPAPEGQSGWSAAVEITPDLTPNREILTTHHFDITKNPIEIVWGKRVNIVFNDAQSIRKHLMLLGEAYAVAVYYKKHNCFLQNQTHFELFEPHHLCLFHKLLKIQNPHYLIT